MTKKEKNKKVDEKTAVLAVNYPVGDFLVRLKNAALARKHEVNYPYTKYVKAVAESLKKSGHLDEVEKNDNNLVLRLTYKKKEPALINLQIISKPGLRVYTDFDELEKKKGPEVYLISTSFGVMTSKEALKKRIGGEIIARIW
jgi:small subunit ribosomal protein S8